MNNQTILDILTQTSEYVSGQALAGTLGVSRQAVWKGIRALREQGYAIESVPNRGYRLRMMPDCLNAAAVRSFLAAAVIGCELEVLESVGSSAARAGWAEHGRAKRTKTSPFRFCCGRISHPPRSPVSRP